VTVPAAPASVEICECWPRDGLQSWPRPVPVADKLAVARRAVAAGVAELDATSFVPAKYVPQFADAEEFLAGLADAGVRTRVLTPNVRGVERAVETQRRLGVINAIGFPVSASEAHNMANLKRTHAEHFAEVERMVDLAHEAGLQVVSAVATAYGCPITGAVPEGDVFAVADRLVELGVDRLMLSDTTGLADPIRVAAYTARAVAAYPPVGLIAHYHDSRGTGIANTWAAVQAGAHCVDACLGGLGGEPASVDQHHAGETGNIVTEDIVVLLERAGIRTGIDIDALLDAGRLATEVVGVAGRSLVQEAGTGLARQQDRGRLSTTRETPPWRGREAR
jgi:hydroxymethylglutaryl-CoA lyase